MVATIHQKNILDLFHKEKTLSLDTLKSLFVEPKIMNQTTLYRILDRWKAEKMIYEIEVDKKRIFLFCDHHHDNEGVKISFCKKCEHTSESHFPLPKNAEHAETIEYLRCCEKCEDE